jgi:MurNAc alpha-1-phosphate uridylyltransferase
MTPTSIMIFAAGRGTRMRELTRDRPKPLIQVNGKPLIDHTLDLVGERASRCVVNVHHHAGLLSDYLKGRDVVISDERSSLLETGGGLRNALPLLGDGPVFTLNSDAVWAGPNPLDILSEAWDQTRMDALLLLLPPENAIGHGGGGDFLRASDGTLRRGPGLIYSGAQIVDPSLLHGIDEEAFSLNRLWDIHLERSRLHGVVYTGRWCDVGRPEGISLAENLLQSADV